MLLILGMTLVTYIPRLLPFTIMADKKLPKFISDVLLFIPATALGALVIPGVFSSIPGKPVVAFIGILFAIIYSWFKGGIIIPVLGSIFTVFLMLSLG